MDQAPPFDEAEQQLAEFLATQSWPTNVRWNSGGRALKVIPAERLIVSTDCGFGRQGMSRLHAFYKMVSLVRGTNIVRKELGLPEADVLAADPSGALI